jgi:hypothetical protein
MSSDYRKILLALGLGGTLHELIADLQATMLIDMILQVFSFISFVFILSFLGDAHTQTFINHLVAGEIVEEWYDVPVHYFKTVDSSSASHFADDNKYPADLVQFLAQIAKNDNISDLTKVAGNAAVQYVQMPFLRCTDESFLFNDKFPLLFVRSQYISLCNEMTAFKADKRNPNIFVLGGNSGVGKSMFIYYFMYRLHKQSLSYRVANLGRQGKKEISPATIPPSMTASGVVYSGKYKWGIFDDTPFVPDHHESILLVTSDHDDLWPIQWGLKEGYGDTSYYCMSEWLYAETCAVGLSPKILSGSQLSAILPTVGVSNSGSISSNTPSLSHTTSSSPTRISVASSGLPLIDAEVQHTVAPGGDAAVAIAGDAVIVGDEATATKAEAEAEAEAEDLGDDDIIYFRVLHPMYILAHFVAFRSTPQELGDGQPICYVTSGPDGRTNSATDPIPEFMLLKRSTSTHTTETGPYKPFQSVFDRLFSEIKSSLWISVGAMTAAGVESLCKLPKRSECKLSPGADASQQLTSLDTLKLQYRAPEDYLSMLPAAYHGFALDIARSMRTATSCAVSSLSYARLSPTD